MKLLLLVWLWWVANVGCLSESLESFVKKTPITAEALHEINWRVQQGHADATYLFAMMKLYGHGVAVDLDDAMRLLKALATDGHRDAAFALGTLYYHNAADRQSASWLSASANQGHADAKWMLATLYNHGRGVVRNVTRALELLQDAALVDANAHACFHLGVMYEYGRGLPSPNATRATELYEHASRHQVVEAKYHLALMHLDGRTPERSDTARAMKLLQEAADRMHAPSMFLLGHLYTTGEIVPVDYVVAASWFKRAAAQNDERIRAKAHAAAMELDAFLQHVDAHIRAQEAALGIPIHAHVSNVIT